MAVSYVVRLVEEALAEGRIAGEVQEVGTGQRTVVKTAEELIALLLADPRTAAKGES